MWQCVNMPMCRLNNATMCQLNETMFDIYMYQLERINIINPLKSASRLAHCPIGILAHYLL